MQSLTGLAKVMRENLRACGYPIVLSRPFDKRTPSHQCGTVRMGNDPADAAARSLVPRLRPPESVRRRRRLPAEFGRRQPGAVDRRAGAARRRPHPQRRISAHEPAGRHRHRRQAAASAWRSRKAWPNAGFDICRDLDRLGDEQARHRGPAAQCRRDVLFHQGDIGDLDGHAPLVDCCARSLRPHRLPGQQCRHRIAGARRPARPPAGQFDQVHVGQSARHGLPDPGGRQGHAGGAGDRARRSSTSPRSAPRWHRRSAPTTASPRPAFRCG